MHIKIKSIVQTRFLWIIAIILLAIPTVFRMIRTGIYSMQDFPYFRLVEYGQCFRDFQLPCRWSPDAGLGFGEPLFNFYGQVSYFLGAVIHIIGPSYIDSLKLLFALSIILSGIGMFFLAKRIWNDNWAALLSSVVYMYAPYRAVDVWVRGALPEAMSFAIIPFVIFELDTFIETRKTKNLLLFSIFLSLLILNHNLSLILFEPFLVIWSLYKLFYSKNKFEVSSKLSIGIILSIFLSAYYLLPVLFESQYINLESTIRGYFDFRAHFVTIQQLLFSRFWGYGGSTWGSEDGLSLSIGQMQWVLPLVAIIAGVFTKSFKQLKTVIILLSIGWLGLFLTHNKSAFLWEATPPMAYIQFPWRFLMLSLFSFSLASGALVLQIKKYKGLVTVCIIVVTILLNFSFFKEDIWFTTTDQQLTTGEKWIEQTRASIGDYWPVYGPIAQDPSRTLQVNSLFHTTSNTVSFGVVSSENSDTEIPVNYFPGWTVSIDGKKEDLFYNENGKIMIHLPEGSHQILLQFKNTPIRTFGNIISIVMLLSMGFYSWYDYKK